jgi:hypothetical protein
MMNRDAELDTWRSEWRSHAETASQPGEMSSAGLRRKAVRQQRILRTRHVCELLFAVILLAFSAAVVWRRPLVETYVWAAVVCVATIVATAFSLWNWRVLWSTDLKSVSDFTRDYKKRCLARRRDARFGEWFLVVQLAISAPWLTLNYARHRITGAAFAGSLLMLVVFSVGFVLLFAHYRRIAAKELAEISATQAAVEAGAANDIANQ